MLARFSSGIALLASALAAASSGPGAAGDAKPPNFRAVAFSPDGKLLAGGCGEPTDKGHLTVWDVATRRPLWTHEEPVGIPSISFSPDGKTLAVGMFGDDAKLLNAEKGAVLAALPGHGKAARAVAFAPDGKTLAVGCYEDTIRLWQVATRTMLEPLPGHGEKRVFCVAWSPDGKLLLSAAGEEVKLWDVPGRQEKHALPASGSYTRSGLFLGGGRWVATGAWDGSFSIFDVQTGEVHLRYSPLGAVEAMAHATATHQLATCGFAREIHLWDARLDEPTETERKRIDELLAQLDEDRFEQREVATEGFRGLGLVAEPTLRRAMRDSPSAEVRIRARRLRQEMLSKPQAVLPGHERAVEAVAFSPDGKLLASGGKDGCVRLWDVAARKELARFGVTNK